MIDPATFLPSQLVVPVNACFPNGVIKINKTIRKATNFFASDFLLAFGTISLPTRLIVNYRPKVVPGSDIWFRYTYFLYIASPEQGGGHSLAIMEASMSREYDLGKWANDARMALEAVLV